MEINDLKISFKDANNNVIHYQFGTKYKLNGIFQDVPTKESVIVAAKEAIQCAISMLSINKR